jgi:predicted secreted Zn-dependent protease
MEELKRMQYRVRGPITPALKRDFEQLVEGALRKARTMDDIVKELMAKTRAGSVGKVPDLLKSSGKRTPF